jgi:hypothetical protein
VSRGFSTSAWESYLHVSSYIWHYETSGYTKQWNLIPTMPSAKNTPKDGRVRRKQTLVKRAHELGWLYLYTFFCDYKGQERDVVLARLSCACLGLKNSRKRKALLYN